MIYFLAGDDTKGKGDYTRKLTEGREVFIVNNKDLNKEILISYATTQSLFGGAPVVVMENAIKEEVVILNTEEWSLLKDSDTLFIFREDKLLANDEKKYKKYGEVKRFEGEKKTEKEKFNVFSITDAYAKRDKITTWTLYRKSIEVGVEPEAIAGVLFWKIKTMLINNVKSFSKDELKRNSSSIVFIYHRAHRGEVDFVVGLEQFILNSLSSR